METIAPIHPLLASAIAEHDRRRDRLLALQPLCIDVDGIIAEMFDVGVKADIMVSESNHAVWILMDEVTDMAAVVVARRAIARHGYTMDRDGHTDYPDDHRFTVDHSREGIGGRLLLSVRFKAPDQATGATCRYVKTGEKTVPVYELQCQDRGAAIDRASHG
jgi:hypothetical protein